MNKLSKLIVAIVASLFISASAMAFEGFSIGIVGGTTDFDTTGSEFTTQTDMTTEKNDGSASKSVDVGSFFAEYTVAQGSTFGIEVVPDTAEIGAKSRTDSNTLATDDGTYTAKANISDHVTVYVEPTYMMNEQFGIYVKGGAARVTVESKESIAFGADSSSYGDVDVWGVMYGAGIKMVGASGLFGKIEATKTEYGTVTLHSTTGSKNTITADPEAEAARIAIGYNF
jgi:hypothetical protein